MPKSTTCLLDGEPIEIDAALALRKARPKAIFHCQECGARVRAHKKGTTGQEAHFEHLMRNPNCKLSIK